MRTVLICHDGDLIFRHVMPRWLSSFSELGGIVVIREESVQLKARVKREISRVGPLRFADVMAYRLYRKMFLTKKIDAWKRRTRQELSDRYIMQEEPPIHYTKSPNSKATKEFIQNLSPDITLVFCKFILKRRIYKIARHGTYVLHPGHCPEYRNAHGCFWALSERDMDKVAASLLRIDAGIDTGPVYAFYTYPFDEKSEPSEIIQYRVILENLDNIREKFIEIVEGRARPIDTQDTASREWGQPWLTRYLAWKLAATREN